jgi:hypothetical protein
MARTQKRPVRAQLNDRGNGKRQVLQNGPGYPDRSVRGFSLCTAEEPRASRTVPAFEGLPRKMPGEGGESDLVASERGQPATATGNVTRFGVAIPVHNEEQLISAALNSLDRSIGQALDSGVSVGIAVVLDRCCDRSSQLASEWRSRATSFHQSLHIEILEMEAGNVGAARRAGCKALLREWSGGPTQQIWLATTDADSEVPRDWISAQLRARNEGAQVWVGGVAVRDWSGRTPGTAAAWRCQYEHEALPIHGANLGIDGATYLETGGFQNLATGEDRDLFTRAIALGAVIRHDPRVRVVTSSRRDARAPRGFAHALTSIEAVLDPGHDVVAVAAR